MNTKPENADDHVAVSNAQAVRGETGRTATALKFEIVNPSDPYTFSAPSLEIAALVMVLLGNGQYCAKSLDTPPGEDVPFFMFGGANKWFADNCGCTAQEAYDRPDNIAMADCLDTVTLGRAERSSLNNIGGRAKGLAEQFRESARSALAAATDSKGAV